MSEYSFTTHSAEQTIALGGELAKLLPPKLIILRGDLGVGKTTLVKGIAAALGVAKSDEVTSPTFTLVHEYGDGPARLYHLDLYRLETERELLTLGMEEMEESGTLMLVEWGEKFPSIAARADGEIILKRTGEYSRTVTLQLKK